MQTHTLSEKIKFFGGFLRSPRQVGSCIPTSPKVIEHLLSQIDWNSARLIVEYGPGVGTITKPILERLHPDGRLIAIDLDPRFVTHLKNTIRDPRLIPVRGSATDVEAIIREHGGGGTCDYCVSGLPFSTLPDGVESHIMAATYAALAPGGALLVYQYSRFVEPLMRRYFGEVAAKRIWLNIPPCHTFSAVKRP